LSVAAPAAVGTALAALAIKTSPPLPKHLPHTQSASEGLKLLPQSLQNDQSKLASSDHPQPSFSVKELAKQIRQLIPGATRNLAKSKKDRKLTLLGMPPKAKSKKANGNGGNGGNGKGKGSGVNVMVSAPVARTMANRAETKRLRSMDGGKSMLLTRREYVRDIVQTTASVYQVENVLISSASFPWAKQYASLFETYQFESLMFEFIPLQATTATGFIVLAPDYDPADLKTVAQKRIC
jgi:hypothetical protein